MKQAEARPSTLSGYRAAGIAWLEMPGLAWGRAFDRMLAPLAIGTIVAVALGGLLGPSVPLPRAAILTPVAYSIAVLGDFATAIILIATWQASESRRSTVVLIFTFAANATMLLVATLALPLLPTVPAVVAAPASFSAWVFVAWHVLSALGAVAYLAFRAGYDVERPSRRFTLVVSTTTILLVGCSLYVAFRFGARLPVLASGGSLAGLSSSGVGPCTVFVLATATVLAFRLREPNSIDRALAFTLLALTLELTILLVGGRRYTTTYYAGRVLVLMAGLFVFVAAIRTLVEAPLRLLETERTLDQVAGRSEKRAGRITAVWKISAQTQASESERARTVLRIATEALRPGRPMMGFISSLDAGQVVVEEFVFTSFAPGQAVFDGLIYRGASFALEDTMVDLLRGTTRAAAWDDLTLVRRQGAVAGALEAKSYIGATIVTAGRTHFVSFASPEAMSDEPFAEDDLAYVDVVASFFASRFEQQQQFKQIRFEIEHDNLTGLENNVQLRGAVRDEIRDGKAFALAFVDIDEFRHVNGREGYQTGDEVLVEVAKGLAGLSGANLVARIGGDQFAVLVRGADSADAAARGVEPVASLFRTPFTTGGADGFGRIPIGASIGVARYPTDGTVVEDLVRRAGVALNVAKSRGGSTTVMFATSMDSILEESRLRFAELDAAISGDQLVLAYQPTFELASRRIVGAEALVRWDHPERGRLPPSEFIDFAERNNLIGPLTLWVFQRVARDLSSGSDWPPGFRIYFNLAAQMLEDVSFIALLDKVLRANPQLTEHLGIEVTESAAMQNVERSMNTIALFRRLGVSVAIDDFGTGHSSLSYLKNLIVDVIKVDRSFVAGLSSDVRDNAIVEMMLRIVDQFGFASLAEGIETEEQLAWLLEHGCRFGQGYLIAKPEAFDTLLGRMGPPHAADSAREAGERR